MSSLVDARADLGDITLSFKPTVSTSSPVSIGHFSTFSWLRAEGKGNFLSSPAVKQAAETEVEEGASQLVLDLQDCPSMDSTFMGTLAGLAMLLQRRGLKRLQVTGLSERNTKSLMELGLGGMLDLEPEQADWRGREDDIRKGLQEPSAEVGKVDKGKHVLEAHETLIKAHSPNGQKFKDVIEFLKPQVDDSK